MAEKNENLEMLAKECSDMKDRLSDLSEEELKYVVGGSGGEESIKFSTFYLSGHIPADEAKVGDYVYVSVDGEQRWYSGTLYQIENVSYWIFFRRRKYYLYLTGYNGYGASGDMIFYSNDVTLYRNMEWCW